MALERLQLTNFRGFESLDLCFEPDLTVLVGVNGCGKTSVIDALRVGLGERLFRQTDLRVGANEVRVSLQFEGDRERSVRGELSDTKFIATRLRRAPDLALIYTVNRQASDLTPGSTKPRVWTAADARSNADGPDKYEAFFQWFREMEDEENERFRHEDATETPQLSAVRIAMQRLLPGYDNLRVLRRGAMGDGRPRLTVEKDGMLLLFDALSQGERSLIAMVADIARRLVIVSPNARQPLEEPFLLIIDEFEQHLHPQWQREFPTRLAEIFPNAQTVLTTHSPIVVSQILPRQLRALQGFGLLEGSHREGQDVNEILEVLFGTPSRNPRTRALIEAVDDALDDDDANRAAHSLEVLEQQLGSDDPEVVRLRTLQRIADVQDHDAVSEG